MRLSHPVPRLAAAALAVGAAVGACRTAPRPLPPPTGWQRVGDGMTCGVSGLAVAPALADAPNGVRLLLVHDNKGAGEPRLATLAIDADGRATYRAVAWRYDAVLRAPQTARPVVAPDSVPVDLEAVAPVPGRDGAYYGMTSLGLVYRFALTTSGGSDAAVVDAVLALRPPAPGDSLAAHANYEGFVALRRADGTQVGIWADRGADARPGMLWWGVLDAAAGPVATTRLDSVRVPWPTTSQVRHLSDLALRGDTLLATAAFDAGDAGPFGSAVYRLGTIGLDGGGAPRLHRATPLAPLVRLEGRKAEAIAVLPGGRRNAPSAIIGTDDEQQGGAIVRLPLSRLGAAGDTVVAAADAVGGRASGACVPASSSAGRP